MDLYVSDIDKSEWQHHIVLVSLFSMTLCSFSVYPPVRLKHLVPPHSGVNLTHTSSEMQLRSDLSRGCWTAIVVLFTYSSACLQIGAWECGSDLPKCHAFPPWPCWVCDISHVI